MGSGWIGSAQDQAITDPTLASGQVSLIALLKGLLTQAQGGGPAGKAQPAVLYGPNGQVISTTNPLPAQLVGSYVQPNNALLPNQYNVLMVGGISQGYAEALGIIPVPDPADTISQAYQFGFVTDSAMRGLISRNSATNVEQWQGKRFSNGVPHRATGAVGAAGSIVIWTPANGYRFRLLGATVAASAATVLTLEDGGTPILDIVLAGAGTFVIPLPDQGIVSAALNNALTLTSSAAATIYATALGLEE